MSYLKAAVLALGLLWSIPNSASGHGTGYRPSEKKAIVLEFYYSTGDTMSYLEAKAFSPEDEKFAYQSGRTDEDGRFAFAPNTAGVWRVVVKDGEGHQTEAKVDVAQEFMTVDPSGESVVSQAVVPKAAVPEGMDLILRGGLGVSLLFNVAALVFFVRQKRQKMVT